LLNYLDISLKNKNDIDKIISLIKDYCLYCINNQQYKEIGIKLINKKGKKKKIVIILVVLIFVTIKYFII
jgi:hypothetical protein